MASLPQWLPSFPLLGKELTELAARPRTYVLRVLTCLGLGAAFLVPYLALAARVRSPREALGQGWLLFDAVYWTVAAAIVALVPVSAAIAVARERENGALVGLLLTPMHPWSLVLQKWASRMIVVATVVAASLPLLALAYGLGGVDERRIAIATAALLVTGAELAAIGIAIGAWTRSSVSATVVTIVAVALLAGATRVRSEFIDLTGLDVPDDPILRRLLLGDLHPLGLYSWVQSFDGYSWRWRGTAPLSEWQAEAAIRLAPALLVLVAALIAARVGIVRGLERRGPGPLLRCFLWLDGRFASAERRIGRRVAVELPEAHPVAWREINRRALANPRYLVRLFLVLGTLALVIAMAMGASWRGSSTLDSLAVLAGALACVIGLALGVTCFDLERTSQTLPVLLTTPLGCRDIIGQKMAAIRRLLWMLGAIVLVVAAVRLFLRTPEYAEIHRLLHTMVLAFMAPMTCAWIGAIAALATRGRARAALLAAGVLGAWLVVPILAAMALGWIWKDPSGNSRYQYEYGIIPLEACQLAAIGSLSPYGASQVLERPAFTWDGVYGRWPGGFPELCLLISVVSCLGLGAMARLVARIAGDRLLRRSAAHG